MVSPLLELVQLWGVNCAFLLYQARMNGAFIFFYFLWGEGGKLGMNLGIQVSLFPFKMNV